MGNKGISIEGIEGTRVPRGTRILSDRSKGRLLRFLFCAPVLGSLRLRPGGFAGRLARVPADLVTRAREWFTALDYAFVRYTVKLLKRLDGC